MSNWQKNIEKVLHYCADHQLLQEGDNFIVGVSGGPDSVFLAHFLSEQSARFHLSCHLAHVNYGMRGSASDEDELLCRELAEQLKWPVTVLKLQPDEAKSSDEKNFQAWARKRRYDFFRELAAGFSATGLIVAHQLTDQVETFLLRLLRGSGPSGLGAMRPRTHYQELALRRPLLCLSRQEILEALAEREIPYRLDASNDSDRYRRNRLRQGVLPQLREIEPHFEKLTGEALLLWQGEDALLRELAAERLQALRLPSPAKAASILQISRQGLQSLPLSLRLRVLREMIAELTGGPQSITFHHVRKMDELVCQGPDQARYDLPEQLLFEQGPLVVTLKVLQN